MATTSLVAEFLLIGLIPFFTIAFAALLFLGVYDLKILFQTKDYLSLLTVCFILLIYLLGALTHRLSQLVNVKSLRFLWKLGSLKSIGQTLSKPEEWLDDYYLVYQLGSSDLCEKIAYNESLLRIFRSVALTLPIFAIVLTIWLSVVIGWTGALTVMIVCLLITFSAVIAIPIQYKNYREIIKHSANIIRKYHHEKSNDNSHM